jgi:protein TonB
MEPFAYTLRASRPDRRRRRATVLLSAAGHGLAITAAVLVPILAADKLPPPPAESIRLFIYDPPPPPPLPLPLGRGLTDRVRRVETRPVEPPPVRETPALEAPLTIPAVPAPVPTTDKPDEAGGSPTGSPSGVPEGMEGGVEGGMIGGVPGGVIGGVIGGTGTGPVPVMDYDRPPRLLRQTKPDYPPDAFVKKVEGVVVIEILIDDAGRVVRARVVQSVPLLDRAALEAVTKWLFVPAVRHGQPVATVAMAPVTFRIF